MELVCAVGEEVVFPRILVDRYVVCGCALSIVDATVPPSPDQGFIGFDGEW